MQMKLKTAGTRALKTVAAIGVAGALLLAVATPSLARDGRNAAAGAGFAAGAVVGAAAANAAYGSRYNYDEPGYGAYAYAPDNASPYGTFPSSCAGDGGYGRTDYGAC